MPDHPHSPGAVRSFSRHGRAVTLDCGGPRVQIVVLSLQIVRVRLAPGGTFAPRRSWAVAPPDEQFAEAPFELREEPSALLIDTGALTVQINRGTCTIAFVGAHGAEFCADAPGISWQTGATGTSVACDKRIAAG